MNKKAELRFQQEYLVFLLILLAVIVVLFIFLNKMQKVSDAQTIPDLCRRNIEVSAIGNLAGMELYDAVKCPTEYHTLGSTDEEQIKQALAKSLVSCWYKMGEGKYEVFDTSTMSETQYCVICSVTTFTGESKEVSGFVKYLQTENAPAYYTKTPGMTYMTYLQGYQSDSTVDLLENTGFSDTFETSGSTAVIFLYAKKGYVDKVWASFGGATAGFVAGTVGGILVFGGVTAPVGLGILATVGGASAGAIFGSEKTSDWESGILLYPYDTEELKKLDCDVLPVSQESGEVSLQV